MDAGLAVFMVICKVEQKRKGNRGCRENREKRKRRRRENGGAEKKN